MGRKFRHYLDSQRVYGCVTCGAHVTSRELLVSKAFQGRQGRAFLFDSAVNVTVGPEEDRMLMTGRHTVCDIFCIHCHTPLGWKYLRAYEESQRYKVGRYIVEKAGMTKLDWPARGMVDPGTP